jgi:hypothetical protein
LLIDNTWALAWAALGGGVGWFVASILAWRMKNSSSPSTLASVALRIIAVGVAVAGVVITRAISSVTTQGSDTNLGYDLGPLVVIVFVDAMLVASTLLLLSRRDRTRHFALATAAAVAALALLGSAWSVASMPAPTQRWLEYWLATRQAPLGAAPNLIVRASDGCRARTPDPYPGDDRSFATDVPSVSYWINPFAPRWLPEGFGLEWTRSWPWPQPHAVWTDPRCREVTLVVTSGRAGKHLEIRRRPHVADRWLTSPDRCPDTLTCRGYVTRATFRDSDADATLVLRTVGVSPREADRIAASIPTDRVPFI